MIKGNFYAPTPARPLNGIGWNDRSRHSLPPTGRSPERQHFSNEFLSAQAEDVLRELLPHLEPVAFNGGDYIYQPGDPIEYVYFPETAVVSEFQILEDGRMIEIAMTGSEGVLGLLPLFDTALASNWTQVSVSGSASRIASHVVEKKMSGFPGFQKRLFEFVSRYVAQISQRSVCNSYHVIEQRFCSWLLMIQERKKSNRLPLTQEQIARSLGVHRPSLTHIAQNLRARRIIDYVRGKIFIVDRAELERSACSCFNDMRMEQLDRVH